MRFSRDSGDFIAPGWSRVAGIDDSSWLAPKRVFNVIDASGNWSAMATDITIARMAQAGAIPIDTLAVLCEIMGTWNRPDAMEYAAIMTTLMPNYVLLMESYNKAQAVAKTGPETDLSLQRAPAGRRG